MLVARNFVIVALRHVENALWHAVLPSELSVHSSSMAASGASPKGSSANARPGTPAVPKKAVLQASPPATEQESQ